jgi:hypothetical protein
VFAFKSIYGSKYISFRCSEIHDRYIDTSFARLCSIYSITAPSSRRPVSKPKHETEESMTEHDDESKGSSAPTMNGYRPANGVLVATNISANPILNDEQPYNPSAVAHIPPEGGLTAWLAVLAFFLTIMNTWCVHSSPTHAYPPHH